MEVPNPVQNPENLPTPMVKKSGSIRSPRDRADREEIILTWHNLDYIIKQKKGKEKTLLNGISGEVKAGQMVAILGSSGAGKSTLLNVLSGRINEGIIKGQILVNGKPRSPKMWMKQCSVVEQDDTFYATVTVKESIQFSANLRLPKQLQSSKNEHVDEVIEELGLINVKTAKIGSATRRGISGGERRRCAIGVEFVVDPMLLMLDEPTSGLDSFIAFNIIDSLKTLAREQKRAVLMTIHQPRETIVALFDKILLLSKGHCVFYGSMEEGLSYFQEIGFPCPENTNPCNHFIDLITIDLRTDAKQQSSEERINKLIDSWRQQATKRTSYTYDPISQYDGPSSGTSSDKGLHRYEASWLYEFTILLKRNFKETTQNPAIIAVTIVQSIFQLILLTAVFNGLTKTQAGIQNRIGFFFFISLNLLFTNLMPTVNTFPLLRGIISRERRANMYRPSTAFLSRTLSSLPLITFQWILFVCIVYWTLGLEASASKYLIYIVACYLHQLVAVCIGLMIGSAVPSPQLGQVIAPLVGVIMIIFGGLVVNLDSLGVGIKWVQYISPISNTVKILAQNEFGGQVYPCVQQIKTPQGSKCIDLQGSDILTQQGLDEPTILICFIANIGILVFFLVTGMLCFNRTTKPKLILK